MGEIIEVYCLDLLKESHSNIEYECDICKNIFSTTYRSYNKTINRKSSIPELQGLSLCKKCTQIKAKKN